MSVRYLKKAERKEQLKSAAIELIIKNGYSNTSVQNIVDKADFSKGGFYNCYTGKEELFKDILQDCMEYRFNKIIALRAEIKDMDKQTFLVESLLDKILDSGEYKELFASLMIEIATNDKLYEFYNECIGKLTEDFIEFCNKEDLPEFRDLANDEFNVLISSLILGVHIFHKYNNESYRQMLREIFKAYFAIIKPCRKI